MPPESLEVLQGRFWRLITAPEGVAAGLPDVARTDPGADPIAGWIHARDEDTARERLDVYANMYFFRILDALRDDVPRVAQLLGEDAFHNLVVDYLLSHPSTNPSLRHAARALPEFIGGHAIGAQRPDLSDLARLELARNDVFDAAGSPVLDASTLSAIAPDTWPRLRFVLAPTTRWLRIRDSVVPTWRALADGEAPPAPGDRVTGCVVWRSRAPGTEDQVWHRAAAVAEVAALDAVAGGATFDAVCEIFAAEAPATSDPADAARPALEALVQWVSDGLLTSVERPAR